MHAYLIYGSNKIDQTALVNKLIKEANIDEVDLLITDTDDKSIGIEEIRDSIIRLQLTPFKSAQHAWIILEADKLTLEAQQAILKTLEEPPSKTIICICCNNKEALLPTIISRCLLIPITNKIQESLNKNGDELLQKLIGPKIELIKYMESIEKDAAAEWIKQAINILHQALISEPKAVSYAKLIKLLFLAQKQLAVNVNHKLVLMQFVYQRETE